MTPDLEVSAEAARELLYLRGMNTRLIGWAAAGVILLTAGCGSANGSNGQSYDDAASVAKAAGLTSCRPDPQEVGVTDAMACAGTTEVDWFKSKDAMSIITAAIDSSPDTFLVGDTWAIECVRRQICVDAQAKIGGDLK